MKQESRQVRRARERQQVPWSREQHIVRWVLMIALCAIVVYAFWPSRRMPSQSTSDPGLPTVDRSESTVAGTVRALIRAYRNWLTTNPRASGEQSLEEFRRLYNEKAPTFHRAGVKVPVASVIDFSFEQKLRPLVDSLLREHLYLLIRAPMTVHRPNLPDAFVYLSLGRIERSQRGTVQTTLGRNVVYHEHWVRHVDAVLTTDIGEAQTIDNQIVYFPDRWEDDLDFAVKVCRAGLAHAQFVPLSIEWFIWHQWGGFAKALRQDQLRTRINDDQQHLVRTHELQHVRDPELVGFFEHTDADGYTRGFVNTLVETRGMLRAISDSHTLYAYGWTRALPQQCEDLIQANAARLTIKLMLRQGQIRLRDGDNAGNVSLLRKRSKSALSALDRIYPRVITLRQVDHPLEFFSKLIGVPFTTLVSPGTR